MYDIELDGCFPIEKGRTMFGSDESSWYPNLDSFNESDRKVANANSLFCEKTKLLPLKIELILIIDTEYGKSKRTLSDDVSWFQISRDLNFAFSVKIIENSNEFSFYDFTSVWTKLKKKIRFIKV